MKPSLPKGTRDFHTNDVINRKYILNIIEKAYQLFGFEPIETPTFENLETLLGKYGEEGDTLLFKILNSGDFLAKVPEEILTQKQSISALEHLSKKGLRYDLTVPFARYVSQHQNILNFPFKRYQIQNVYRADRPQKGRYQEFTQCDADSIGSNSMLFEAEFLQIYQKVFTDLGLLDHIQIKINHRQLLEGMFQEINFPLDFKETVIIIDKLDKIGWDGVSEIFLKKEVRLDHIKQLQTKITQDYLTPGLVINLQEKYPDNLLIQAAAKDLKEIVEDLPSQFNCKVEVDLSLARGLDYYTGCIFEVVPKTISLGSISGGGRYAHLTDMFGLKNMSGVGISFGLDRIVDLMQELNLIQNQVKKSIKILLCHIDTMGFHKNIDVANLLRDNGIACVLYPGLKKMKKQMEYAAKCAFDYVIITGEEEVNMGEVIIRNMELGMQRRIKNSVVPDYFLDNE